MTLLNNCAIILFCSSDLFFDFSYRRSWDPLHFLTTRTFVCAINSLTIQSLSLIREDILYLLVVVYIEQILKYYSFSYLVWEFSLSLLDISSYCVSVIDRLHFAIIVVPKFDPSAPSLLPFRPMRLRINKIWNIGTTSMWCADHYPVKSTQNYPSEIWSLLSQ